MTWHSAMVSSVCAGRAVRVRSWGLVFLVVLPPQQLPVLSPMDGVLSVWVGWVQASSGWCTRGLVVARGSLAAWLVKVRRRRLLLTTKTLENAIAAPASIGFSS